MHLRIDPKGQVTCLYDEVIDLAVLGEMSIRRASHVEPDAEGQWWADLSPVGGERLGPFTFRSEALRAEVAWIDRHLFVSESCLVTEQKMKFGPLPS